MNCLYLYCMILGKTLEYHCCSQFVTATQAATAENDTHVKSHTWPFEPKMCTTLLEPVVATHVPCGCHENTMGPWP